MAERKIPNNLPETKIRCQRENESNSKQRMSNHNDKETKEHTKSDFNKIDLLEHTQTHIRME